MSETSSDRINFNLRNSPGGLPGVLVGYHEDGTVTRKPISTRSLRDVFEIPEESVAQEEVIEQGTLEN